MAIYTPNKDYIINKLQGDFPQCDHYLLNTLQSLDDNYHIFYNPFFSGYRPTVVIVHQEIGIVIIKVNTSNNTNVVQVEMDQLNYYKKSLYDFYLEDLLTGIVGNKAVYALVKLIAYFPNLDMATLQNEKTNCQKQNPANSNSYSFIDLLGNDSFVLDTIKNLQRRDLFTNRMFSQSLGFFDPILTKKEVSSTITLDDNQLKLSESIPDFKRKIRGVAGAGKTVILAARAINARKRTGKPVLILTYNVTLINYIYNKIFQLIEDAVYDKTDFHVINFHMFIRQSVIGSSWYDEKNINNSDDDGIDAETDNIINDVVKNYEVPDEFKFDTILIDEVQDFDYDWLNFILKKWLKPNGEYVLFGDEKQNIYERKQDISDGQNKNVVRTNVSANWNKLTVNYRLENKISDLAFYYQKEFMSQKYETDEDKQTHLQSHSVFEYYNYNDISYDTIYDIILQTKEKLAIQNDTSFFANSVILSTQIECLRDFEEYLLTKNIGCTTTFESNEQYNKLKNDPIALSKLGRTKKINFNMDTQDLKMSTIHSFKGWEVETLFLILPKNHSNSINSYELIYTAITRCRKNLVVIDLLGRDEENGFYQFFTKTESYINPN